MKAVEYENLVYDEDSDEVIMDENQDTSANLKKQKSSKKKSYTFKALISSGSSNVPTTITLSSICTMIEEEMKKLGRNTKVKKLLTDKEKGIVISYTEKINQNHLAENVNRYVQYLIKNISLIVCLKR